MTKTNVHIDYMTKCVRLQQNEHFNRTETGLISDSACDCGVPCEMHTYEPTMSYAQLSQFNIERMVLVDPENRQRYATSLYSYCTEMSAF